MEKCYQLCDAGDKIVLRQLTEPDYEMRTVLVADSLVDIRDAFGHERRMIDNKPFFVLRTKESYFLCWERRNLLQIVSAENYCLLDENVIIEHDNCWYWWSSEASGTELQPLGEKLTSLDGLFALKQERGYVLSYFEQGTLHIRHCLNYKVLQAHIITDDMWEKELFPDVLCLTEQKGESFLSIEKVSESSRIHGHVVNREVYSFIFKEESAESLIKFAAYVRDFCERMSGSGVGVTRPAKICSYAYLCDYLEKDLNIPMHVNLQGGSHSNIMVYANVSKLYRGEHNAYQIYCAELDYFNTADSVWLEDDMRQKRFFISFGGTTDVISCLVNDVDEKALTLTKNV